MTWRMCGPGGCTGASRRPRVDLLNPSQPLNRETAPGVTRQGRRYNPRPVEMVVADNLVKSFPVAGGQKRAVDGLSFRVARGEIFGLLGPNGAGKTTTLRMLSGMILPTSGSARLAGYDVATQPFEVKRVLGFLTANTGLYLRLTPRELLQYFAELHGMDRPAARRRAEHLVDWLDMREFADLRCGSLSTGQRQRVNIGRVLVADPPVLVMDEPTLGLDVISNRLILDFIRRAGDEGKTILLSTHYLDEAEMLCDRIGFLHHGRLIAEGTLEELQRRTGLARLSAIFLKLAAEGTEAAAPAGAGS